MGPGYNENDFYVDVYSVVVVVHLSKSSTPQLFGSRRWPSPGLFPVRHPFTSLSACAEAVLQVGRRVLSVLRNWHNINEEAQKLVVDAWAASPGRKKQWSPTVRLPAGEGLQELS